MALFWLMNNVRVGTNQLYAGSSIDDSVEDTTAIASAGGVLFAQGTSAVDDAAVQAQSVRKSGGDPGVMEGLMNSALDSVQGTAAATATAQATADAAVVEASVQTGTATLSAGAVAVTSPNITANSVIIPIRNAELGTIGDLSITSPTPGTPGSFNIVSDNGSDVSTVIWLVIA